jgi:uncharacterized membrane protein
MKGINGVLEIIAGFVLMFVGTLRINRMLEMMTQALLVDSPQGWLLKLLSRNGVAHQIGPVTFAVVYLLSNGLAKVVIVNALMKRRRRVFPYAMAFLGLFVLFGLVRLYTHRSPVLAVALVLDLVVMALIWREYRALEAEESAVPEPGQVPEFLRIA